jgi:pimeloyl-ACP methyl ester carboxylesterase
MKNWSIALRLIATVLLTSAAAQVAAKDKSEPLTIQEQGSFAVGGKVTTNRGTFNPKQPTPQGQTLHGDHAYVFYQIPMHRRKLPLVFLHGTGQFSKTWETTPDGREGFQTIFLRRRFPVYLIDQPRRGNAGRSTVSATIAAVPDDAERGAVRSRGDFRCVRGSVPQNRTSDLCNSLARWRTRMADRNQERL